MHKFSRVMTGSACALVAAFDFARAATLVPIVPAPNSSVTTAFAVNDSNLVAGSFIGSGDGIEHAFFGTIDGTYTTFDVGSGGSEARGIGRNGTIVGISNTQGGTSSNEPIFARLPTGKILNVTIHGQQLFGLAQELNRSEVFAGYRWNFDKSIPQPFIGKKGKWQKDIELPLPNQFGGALGINDAGIVVGFFLGPPLHGFVLDGQTETVVDYPGASATILNGINNKGEVAGQWLDSAGNQHSFVYDTTSAAFTDILIKHASTVRAWAINSAGAVAVSTDIGSFLWCAKKKACPAGGSFVSAPTHVSGKPAVVVSRP